MVHLVWVGCGGLVGAIFRYALTMWIDRSLGGPLPLGTFGVNVAGCFVIGIAWVMAETRHVANDFAPLVIAGFLGGFTTFSTFGLQAVRLLQESQIGLALVYVLAHVVGGILAVYLGMLLARAA